MPQDLQDIARALVAEGKGILAADETVPTLTRRFDRLGISSSEQSRCTYREMLFTTPDAANFTSAVLFAVFNELAGQGVALEAMLLKPNMVVPGEDSSKPPSIQEVAAATLRCLRRHVPAAVPGIVFLSGGQDERVATAHLNAINRLPGSKPWTISFSYGRALQDPALEAWHGRDENRGAGQKALRQRARCNGAACLGTYTDGMEEMLLAAGGTHRLRYCDS
jgi:fructose-bisphosphate aldolase class I